MVTRLISIVYITTVIILYLCTLEVTPKSTTSSKLKRFTFNHGQKSWGTFAFLGRFPIHTRPTPPLTPQTNVGRVYPEFFPSFNFV